MKSIKLNQGLATGLTALATAMLCQSTATYASDIEIYKAPTRGGASLMLVLDVSGSMSVTSSGGGNPVNTDFGTDCSTGDSSKSNRLSKTVSTTFDGTTYSFVGEYCKIASKGDKGSEYPNTSEATNRAAIVKSCDAITDKNGKITQWECPDRFTSLRISLFELINGSNEAKRLPSTTIVGLTQFPNSKLVFAPKALSSVADKKDLLNKIKNLSTDTGTPIAEGYGIGVNGLFKSIGTSESACAGYGTYILTDGAPNEDSGERSTAKTNLDAVLGSNNAVTCSGSWSCVENAASKLVNSNISKKLGSTLSSQQNMSMKTAVVGFGKEFSFGAQEFDPKQTYSEATLKSYFTGNALDAAKAANVGRGGWYSAADSEDIIQSVQNFVNSIQVDIPAITTGTSAIPQDALNSSVIQPYAYFPQFQPKPANLTQAWTGNLKKYRIVGGVLKAKDGTTSLFSSAGNLNTAAEDLWTQNYAANTTLTPDQEKLKTLGGLLSRINLKATSGNTAFQRKVYTNTGSTVSEVTEAYIKGAPTSRGYFLGMLGYNMSTTQIAALTNNFALSSLNSNEELRQIGAVMHSTPVLLTQSGTISYSTGVDTTNRDDYLLFGTTQGALHVVKAGTATDVTKVNNTAGNEVFAFVPEETLTNQPTTLLDPKYTPQNGMDQLYYGVDAPWTAHTEYVYVAGTSTTNDPLPDGTFTVYDSATKKGKQWVYGGLRMGGRSYYALDLTNLTASTANAPVVKFRINPANSRVDGFTTPSGETTRYANLGKMGQSWSKPTIANVQWKGKRRLVMFVGGGYDAGYEAFNYNQSNGVGAGVYMFDANTGEFLWSTYDAIASPVVAGKTLIGDGDHLKYSVVSQIKVVDREGDGDVDHLYFGDLGGQVFRVDLDKNHTGAGTHANFAQQITRIVNLNNTSHPGYSPRFYEMPAFTVYSGDGGLFAVISIGSGNRSTPLLGKLVNGNYIVSGETATTNGYLVKDAIYNIYDKVVVKSSPHTETLATSPTLSNLYALSDSNRVLAATTANNPTPSNLATWKESSTTYKGWYYPFTSSAAVDTRKAVEKVQGEIIAIDNDLYVSTFDAEGVGSTEACGAGIYGNSRAHRFCMPYGQCNNGDTVANNTLVLGKGLLGVTVGPGTNAADRRIIASVPSLTAGNQVTALNYTSTNRLIPQSWFEKH